MALLQLNKITRALNGLLHLLYLINGGEIKFRNDWLSHTYAADRITNTKRKKFNPSFTDYLKIINAKQREE